MAIDYARMEIASAKNGGSAVGLSAYVGRDQRKREYSGDSYNFTKDRADLVSTGIILPANSPERLKNGQQLWNEAEAADQNKYNGLIPWNSQLAFHMVLALPDNTEISDQQRKEMVERFVQEEFTSKGHAVEFAHHKKLMVVDGEATNNHGHLIISTRKVNEHGFYGNKTRTLLPECKYGKTRNDNPWKVQWGEFQDRYFEGLGLELRVDQNKVVSDLHMGAAWHMEGTEKEKENALRQSESRQAALHDPASVLARLTERRATFTDRELNTLLKKSGLGVTEIPDAARRVLEYPEVMRLHDPATGEETGRYTTKEVRLEEHRCLGTAKRLKEDARFAVRPEIVEAVAARFTLDPEQKAALKYATSAEGFGIVQGGAGTGKSHVNLATFTVYEASGRRVIGLAPTNSVSLDMKKAGFKEALTIHSALLRQENGIGKAWDSKTVLIVDEAGMVGNTLYKRLLIQAEKAKAKILLVGDEKQLASVDRGGVFSEMVQRLGSAEIKTVRRQDEAWQREASEQMREGNFRAALTSFDVHGAIIWSEGKDAQTKRLLDDYGRDMASDPERARFIIAATNDQVNAINRDVREIHVARGAVRGNFEFTTCKGRFAFGVGDRLMLHGTDKRLGLFNSNVGTIEKIDQEGNITARFDSDPSRFLTFNGNKFQDFSLGYAGTVYKSQGKTIPDVYALHGNTWESRTSYVAATRHKANFRLYVDRQLVPSVTILARQMARQRGQCSSLQWLTAEEVAKRRAAHTVTAQAKAQEAKPSTAKEAVLELKRLQANERVIGRCDVIDEHGGRKYARITASDGSHTHMPYNPVLDKYSGKDIEVVKDGQGKVTVTPSRVEKAEPARPITPESAAPDQTRGKLAPSLDALINTQVTPEPRKKLGSLGDLVGRQEALEEAYANHVREKIIGQARRAWERENMPQTVAVDPAWGQEQRATGEKLEKDYAAFRLRREEYDSARGIKKMMMKDPGGWSSQNRKDTFWQHNHRQIAQPGQTLTGTVKELQFEEGREWALGIKQANGEIIYIPYNKSLGRLSEKKVEVCIDNGNMTFKLAQTFKEPDIKIGTVQGTCVEVKDAALKLKGVNGKAIEVPYNPRMKEFYKPLEGKPVDARTMNDHMISLKENPALAKVLGQQQKNTFSIA